jgi:hypothetical protein
MSKAALKDIIERVVRTFVAVFGTAVVASWTSGTEVAKAKALLVGRYRRCDRGTRAHHQSYR